MAKFADNFEGWYKYAERAAGRPPRPLLVEAVTRASGREAALDIGAGALNDTIHLLGAGFAHVTALDGEPIAQQIADTLPPDRFAYVISRFEDFAFPPAAYDLLNAQYALPFIRPDRFDRVFAAILAALKPGAIITGQLFGDRDDWVGTSGMTFHTRAAAEALLAPLTLLSFREEDDPNSQTLNGTAKHWHLFHFLARRD
ncbi:class I SAM-dependent methyltransferase [Devosia ginsengisoli]|uniref:class I SAM-dependent methyltransferase n=1 Tax=Devosia ginsengisoli TaxID=400770 RepID=UPI0026ED8366|nr:class I SAM-dependent methyltransferase [Devosia ginsengisoli]MCR6671950.1 class I SAM-dependent methyltransferase [Devosia ginsengisoli]